MKIEYLQHAPRNGEPYGTIFVRFVAARSEDRFEIERLTDMLDRLSSWKYHVTVKDGQAQEFAVKDWHTALAILSFSGGTEIQRW